MLGYSIVSIFCIILMFGIVAYFIVNFFFFFKTEHKKFQKGKFALIYPVALPLNFMINKYAGQSNVVSFYSSISDTLEMVVLKFNLSSELFQANDKFEWAYYMCATLVIINSILIAVSLLYRNLKNIIGFFNFKHGKKDKCIIIGNNINSQSIYRTCKIDKILVDEINSVDREKLFGASIIYKSINDEEKLKDFLIDQIERILMKSNGRKVSVIINCDDKEKNIAICGYLTEYISNADSTGFDAMIDRFDVYAFGDSRYEEMYFKYEDKAKGCFHFINQYRQIAIDFIDKYPMTRFMDENYIDYSTSLVKEGVDLNVVMLGFGKANRQLFVTMVANNQFLTEDKSKDVVQKSVRYRLFDVKHTDTHKRANREYFRYSRFFDDIKADADRSAEYLPIIDKVADDECIDLDLDDIAFFDKLKAALSFGEKAINYIVISLGEDYLNITTANKICSVLKEWKIKSCRVFIKVRNKKTYKAAQDYCDPDYCIPYGEEESVIYDFANITKEKFSQMAITRNFIYDVEKDIECENVSAEKIRESQLNWYLKRDSIQRESNIYAILSIRSKLNMIGLDYCDKNDHKDKREISYGEYMERYAANDMPFIPECKNGETKKIVYPLEFIPSLRKNLAMQEHARWNAFMIMKGFLPAKIEDILNEVDKDGQYTNGKNFAIRHHGNLTTFEGLETFRHMVAERDKVSEKDCDVIKYDYQLMDGAWQLLDKSGYKVIER